MTKDKHEKWSVQFHQLDSYDILKFIICTCRMYWEKEADILKEEGKTEEEILQYFRDNVTLTSPLLSKEDQQSQVQHFANKIWILGYLMHPHNRTTDRGVWITEFKNTLYKDKSYGGTGKTTLFHKMLEMVTPTFETGSKDPNEKTEFKMTEFQDGVHAYICFGETPAAVYFSRFYKSFVDGRGIINEKKGKYAAQKEPTKVSILSNHMPLDIDEPTTYRRLIFGFMSDFFHSNMDKEDYESYESDVTGQIFFEKELFDDWTPKEWQKQWELMIAIQMFYFNHTTPIQVLDKVREKAKNSVITDADIDFFNGYIFANAIMVLSELYDTYREAFKSKTSAAMITKKLKAWAASGNVTTKDGEPEKGYYNHPIWCQWKEIKINSKGQIQKKEDGKVVNKFVIVTESALQEMQREREKQANQGDTPNEAPF